MAKNGLRYLTKAASSTISSSKSANSAIKEFIRRDQVANSGKDFMDVSEMFDLIGLNSQASYDVAKSTIAWDGASKSVRFTNDGSNLVFGDRIKKNTFTSVNMKLFTDDINKVKIKDDVTNSKNATLVTNTKLDISDKFYDNSNGKLLSLESISGGFSEVYNMGPKFGPRSTIFTHDDPRLISAGATYVLPDKVVLDSSGNVYSIGRCSSTYINIIKTTTAGDLSTLKVNTNNPIAVIDGVGIDNQNNIHVIYRATSGSYNYTYHVRISPAGNILNTTNLNYPENPPGLILYMVIDGAKIKCIASFQQGGLNRIGYFHSTDYGVSWTNVVNIFNASIGVFNSYGDVCYKDGIMHVMLYIPSGVSGTETYTELRYAKHDGTNWSVSSIIGNRRIFGNSALVALSGGKLAYLHTKGTAIDSNFDLDILYFDGVNWTNYDVLNENNINYTELQAISNLNDEVWISLRESNTVTLNHTSYRTLVIKNGIDITASKSEFLEGLYRDSAGFRIFDNSMNASYISDFVVPPMVLNSADLIIYGKYTMINGTVYDRLDITESYSPRRDKLPTTMLKRYHAQLYNKMHSIKDINGDIYYLTTKSDSPYLLEILKYNKSTNTYSSIPNPDLSQYTFLSSQFPNSPVIYQNTLYFVMQGRPSGYTKNQIILAAINLSTLSWTLTNLSQDDTLMYESLYTTISITSTGTIYLATLVSNASSVSCIRTKVYNAASWSAWSWLALGSSNYDQGYPIMKISPEGVPHIVFTGRDGTYSNNEIYVSRYSSNTWSTPVLISAVSERGSLPKVCNDISFTSSGDMVVIYGRQFTDSLDLRMLKVSQANVPTTSIKIINYYVNGASTAIPSAIILDNSGDVITALTFIYSINRPVLVTVNANTMTAISSKALNINDVYMRYGMFHAEYKSPGRISFSYISGEDVVVYDKVIIGSGYNVSFNENVSYIKDKELVLATQFKPKVNGLPLDFTELGKLGSQEYLGYRLDLPDTKDFKSEISGKGSKINSIEISYDSDIVPVEEKLPKTFSSGYSGKFIAEDSSKWRETSLIDNSQFAALGLTAASTVANIMAAIPNKCKVFVKITASTIYPDANGILEINRIDTDNAVLTFTSNISGNTRIYIGTWSTANGTPFSGWDPIHSADTNGRTKYITANITLSADDIGKTIICNSASVITITLPANAVMNTRQTAKDGSQILFLNYGTALPTFATSGAAVLISEGSKRSMSGFSIALVKTERTAAGATDVNAWALVGGVK